MTSMSADSSWLARSLTACWACATAIPYPGTITTRWALSSTMAISSAVVLACSKAFGRSMNDEEVLRLGAKVSIETKVSITGAYDDACACYFGGFNVTDNSKMQLIRREIAPKDLHVVIFLPKSRKRGNLKKLKEASKRIIF